MMFKFFVCFVIEILHQTTTDTAWSSCIRLSFYLIGILHQTTTHPRHECRVFQLYLIEIYIKPQHGAAAVPPAICCILLKFYIKPQRRQEQTLFADGCILLKFYIKPQQRRTSYLCRTCCILLKFYIKPQQWKKSSLCGCSCILLKFYIKPQPGEFPSNVNVVVSYWNSTSNHNAGFTIYSISVLYAVLSGREIECRTFVEVSLMRFFVFQRTKIPFFQKNSNCCGMSGFARSLLPQKLRMSPYCLSVTDRILVNPAGGIDRRTRLMWTCMFSFEAQCLTYTEYCIIVKPSFSNALRNCAAWRRSVLVLVGRSKKTNNHMIR